MISRGRRKERRNPTSLLLLFSRRRLKHAPNLTPDRSTITTTICHMMWAGHNDSWKKGGMLRGEMILKEYDSYCAEKRKKRVDGGQ